MNGSSMNIGQAARVSGLSPKMIRYYEELGLVPKARRFVSGHRLYTSVDVQTLQVIKQARDLGFPIERIKKLLRLWQNRQRPSRRVKEVVDAHVRELEERIVRMHAMKRQLEALAQDCLGDDSPDCPILAGLQQYGRHGPEV